VKLAHPEMETLITIEPDRVSTLVIENRGFFRAFCEDMQKQINGESGNIVLSDDNRIIDFSRNADLTECFLGFTLNRKPLLSKIGSVLEKAAVAGENYALTAEMISRLEEYVSTLTQDFACNIECGKITAGSLIKAAGISIVEDYDDPLEHILDYMELVREFLGDRLFIFINMRAWFDDEALDEFFVTALAHEYKILLIDAFSAPVLEHENRVTIDDDLCEF